MSLITDFPFKAFMADLKTRHTADRKTGLSLSLLTSSDMEAIATVEVRAPCREENPTAPWEAVVQQGECRPTFYDTRMGNFQVKGFPTRSCSTCGCAAPPAGAAAASSSTSATEVGQDGLLSSSGSTAVATASAAPYSFPLSSVSSKYGNERCSGHFGFISMPRKYPLDPTRRQERLHVINPHLLQETLALLRAECFFCHRFRAPAFDVERFRLALVLADAGLPGVAREFLEVVMNSRRQARKNTTSASVSMEKTVTSALLRERIGQLNSIEDMQQVVQRLLETHQVNLTRERKEEEMGGVHPTAGSSTVGMTTDPWSSASMGSSFSDSYNLASFDVRYTICHDALVELQKYQLECSHCQCCSPSIRVHNGHLFFHFGKYELTANLSKGVLEHRVLQQWEALNTLHGRRYNALYTDLAREHIKALCQRESAILGMVFQRMGEATIPLPFEASLSPPLLYKVFFLDKVLVPPLPVRLGSGVQLDTSGRIVPDDCTRRLSQILKCVDQIERYFMLRANALLQAQQDKKEEEEAEATPHSTGATKKPGAKKKATSTTSHGPTPEQERIHERNLQDLQTQVSELYHSVLDSFAKKEGLYRMHMMGKRVNQACRSVISPDYLLEPNELLLPRPFARRLTFPEQVSMYSPARAALLQRCVINGPHVYPGATHLEWRLSSGEVLFVNLNGSEAHRRQHANRYFAMAQSAVGHTLIVHRHILDGDRVIFNRQPTLHKVSMMGYRVKVLSGLKTLRFHYINSKSYNADFDGDEMNVHVPQSLEAKAELDCLMDADLHYLIPTSGKPIRGLIQDHLVAAVLLTLRDKFFDRHTFTQLVFQGLYPYLQQQQQQAHGAGVRVLQGSSSTGSSISFLIPIPAILWPVPLWTGKQLVSVVIRFVTGVVTPVQGTTTVESHPAGGAVVPSAPSSSSALEDFFRSSSSSATAMTTPQKSNDGLHVRAVSLIQPNLYITHLPDATSSKTADASPSGSKKPPPSQMVEDSTVVLHHSTLLTGVLDKNQLGPTFLSIPHLIHEGYGAPMVGRLFAALGRILTTTLQAEGFSMGLDDMMVLEEDRRSTLLEALDMAPLHMASEKEGNSSSSSPEDTKEVEEEEAEDEEARVLPRIMKLATAFQNEFIPARLLIPFPRNQLLMMTASGAKGSNTNAIQMALGLGQQLFDGRRVSRMNSGKTLPAFFIGDRRARSFGYAMGRFVSGIRPAEYTIHAMAGRDGLIDTAVKTSRSGHLQRCLIKGLEGLVVHWDSSVRESTSKEIFQFKYGGDGLDPVKASTLQNWEVAMRNAQDWSKRFGMDAILGGGGGGNEGRGNGDPEEDPMRRHKKTKKEGEEGEKAVMLHSLATTTPGNASLVPETSTSVGTKRQRWDDALIAMLKERRTALFRHAYQMHRNEVRSSEAGIETEDEEGEGTTAVLPKHLLQSLRAYLKKDTTPHPLFKKVSQIERWIHKSGAPLPSPEAAAYVQQRLRDKREASMAYYEDVLADMTMYKRARCFCDAGEPVGLLAAQAAGEPSTQMTLNTFHSAGATVTHVTEGIPRLRELLLYASVKKSAVVIPVEHASPEEEERIAKILRVSPVLKLGDCLARVPLSSLGGGGGKEASRARKLANMDPAAAAARGYHYRVIPPTSHSASTRYVISLLFSYAALDYARECACMSRQEHVSYFRLALREFAKRVVALLSGTQARGEGSGAVDEEEEDDRGETPTRREGEGVFGEEKEKESDEDEDEDEDEEDEQDGLPSSRRSKRRVSSLRDGEDRDNDDGLSSTSSRSSSSERNDDNEDSEDEEDDEQKENTSLSDLSFKKHRKTTNAKRHRREASRSSSRSGTEDEEDEDEEEKRTQKKTAKPTKRRRRLEEEEEDEPEETVTATRKAASASSRPSPSSSTPLYYSSKEFVQDAFSLRSDRFVIRITPRVGAPAPPSSSSPSQEETETNASSSSTGTGFPLPSLPKDFFVIEIQIDTKKPHVVVLPDVLDHVLDTLEFPSWLPHFDSVTFTRKAEDPHSGELVFQGSQATLDKVLGFLSLLLVDTEEAKGGMVDASASPSARCGIQLHKARSTNIHHMIQMLGVEAGYKTLLDELTSLFKRYAVDYHHLTLIADAATHRGYWENFNFNGIVSHSASPLFQMTVASSKKFLHTAVTHGVGDHLNSFSASIMVGEKPKVGTACVKVLPNPVMLPDILERQFTL